MHSHSSISKNEMENFEFLGLRAHIRTFFKGLPVSLLLPQYNKEKFFRGQTFTNVQTKCMSKTVFPRPPSANKFDEQVESERYFLECDQCLTVYCSFE